MSCIFTYQNKEYTRDQIEKVLASGEFHKLIDVSKEKAWLKEKLGLTDEEIPIVKGIIGNDALGKLLSDGKILLSELAEEGTGYHEAFHRVLGMFLTEGNKNSLFREFESRKGSNKLIEQRKQDYPDYSHDALIEEILADEFKDFVLANGIYDFPQVQKSWFDKILDFLRKMLKIGNSKSLQEQLYRNIEAGDFNFKANKYTDSKDKRINYKFNGEDLVVDELTKQALTSGMNYLFLDHLLTKKQSLYDILDGKLESNPIYVAIRPKMFEAIMDKFNKLMAKGNPSQDETRAIVHALNFMKSGESYRELVKVHEDYLKSFGIKLRREAIDEELDTEDSEVKEGEGTPTQKDISFTKVSFEYDPFESVSLNMKLILASIPKTDKNGNDILNTVGLKEAEDFAMTFTMLSQTLAGIPADPDLFLKKLLEIKYRFPSVINLIQRLGLTNEDLGVNIDSYNDRKLINEFVQSFAKTRYNYTLTFLKDDGNIITIDAEIDNSMNKLRSEWQSRMNQWYGNNFNELKTLLKNLNSNRGDYFRQLSGTLKVYPTDEMLEDLSIQESLNRIRNILIESSSSDFSKAIDSKKNDFKISGDIDKIVKAIAENSTFVNLQHFNSENKAVYGISLNTNFSTIADQLNYYNTREGIEENLPHLLNINTVNSLVLNKVLDGKKLRIVVADGITTEDPSIDGEKSSDIKGPMRLSQTLNDTLNGIFHFMQTGDREVVNALKIGNGELLWNPIGSIEEKIDISKTNKTYLDSFLGYLVDEVNTQKLIKSTKELDDLSNIHKKGNIGLKFFSSIFTDLDKRIDTLKNMDSEELILALEYYREGGDSVSKDLKILFDSLSKDIDKFILSEVQKHKELYENSGVLKEFKNRYAGVSSEHVKKYGSLDNTITISVINQIMGNIEQSKLFFGDLGFYKNPDDAFKRFTMYNSTKKVSINDKRNNQYITETNNNPQYHILLSDGTRINYNNKKNSDYTKINEVVLKDANFVSTTLDQIGKIFKESLKKDFSNEKEVTTQTRVLKDMYEKIEEGDGLSWVNIYFHREIYIKSGDWRRDDELMFLKVINGEQIDENELRRFVMSKPQYTGPLIYTDNYENLDQMQRLFVPAGRKTSYLPLIPQLIKGTNLELLHETMLKNGVDAAHLDSAGKYGAKLSSSFYNEDGSINDYGISWATSKLDYKFLGLQLDMNNEPKKHVTTSTQARKNLLHNQFDNGIPIDFNGNLEEWNEHKRNWDKYSKEQKNKISELATLVSEYNDLDEELTEKSIRELKRAANITEQGGVYKVNNWSKFKKLLQDAAEERNSSDNVIDSIKALFKEGKTGKINSYPNKVKLEQLLMSVVTNRIIRQKRNGDSKPQSSVKGFESKGTKRLKDKNGKNFFASDVLKSYEEKDGKLQPAEFAIPLPEKWINYAKSLSGNRNNLEEGLDILNQKIKEDENFLRDERLFHGLRIPNQSYASNAAGIIKFFLHPTAYTVVVPTEFIKQTGSDFDIDKLVMYLKNTNIPDNEGTESSVQPIEEKYDESKSLQENSREAIENKIIDVSHQLLLHPLNARQLIMPVDDSFLKSAEGLLGEILKLKGMQDKFEGDEPKMKLSWTDVFLPRINYIKFKDFFAGLAGVGQTARHIPTHALAQIKGLTINPANKVYFSGSNNKIGSIRDASGRWITEILSAYLTGNVDAGKNPYLRNIGITTRTIPIAIYLIKRGSDYRQVMKFLSQPVIQKYLQEMETNESQFIQLTGRKGLEQGNIEIAKKSVAFFGIPSTALFYNKNEFMPGMFNDATYEPHREEELNNGLSLFKGNLDNSGLFFSKVPEMSEEQKKYQGRILNEFLYYTAQSKLLEEFISISSPDTSSEKSLNEVYSMQDAINNFREKGFIENFNDYLSTTDPFARILLPFAKARNMKTMFSTLDVVYSNPKFRSAIKFIELLGSKGKSSEQRDRVSINASNDFILYAISKGLKLHNVFDTLMINSKSVGKRLNEIKNDEDHPLFENGFIQAILPTIGKYGLPTSTDTKYDTIQLYTKKMNTPEINLITEELAKIKKTDIKLYNDVILVNFIQSGLNNSPFQLQQVIPVADYNALINDIVEKIPDTISNSDLDKFITEFALNRTGNFYNNTNRDAVWSVWNGETKQSTISFADGPKMHPPIGSFNLLRYAAIDKAHLKLDPSVQQEGEGKGGEIKETKKNIEDTETKGEEDVFDCPF